jgi:hypothetical protein
MADEYTASRSRPGARLDTGTDDRELFLVEFGGILLQAYDETNDYQDLSFTKAITQGKADTFPIIGRKRDATEHEPGERILGGTVEHNDIEITLDKMMVDSIFIADIDELMNHYSVMAPYANQLGQSMSTLFDRRAAIMHILASRTTDRPYGVGKLYVDGGGPLPNGYFDADVATDPAKLESAANQALQWIKLFDIGGGALSYRMGWGQYILMSKYTPLDSKQWTGTSNRAQGTTGMIGGIMPKPTNHIPRANITTGLAKFQGNFSGVVGHISNMMAVGTLTRRGLTTRVVDQPDRLGTLMLVSQFNGMGRLRPECSFEVATSDVTSLRGASHPDAALAIDL